MKKSSIRFTNRALKRGVLALVFLSAVATAVWLPKSIRSQQIIPQVENRTQALQVVSIVAKGDDYILTLKNGSDKPINGYSLGMSSRRTLDADLTTTDRVIAPGATFEERIPASNLQPSPASASLQPTIIITAVMFEDSTSEGEPATVARNKARRTGKKGQFNNILPLIKAVLKVPDSELPAALDRLKAQIAALPETPGNGLPPAAISGLKAAKQDVMMMLQNLQVSSNLRAELSNIEEHIEKKIGKL